MRISRFVLLLAAAPFLSNSVAAQSEPGAPLSAIDWLSDIVANPPAPPKPKIEEPEVAETATVSEITVSSLGTPSLDAVGVLSRTTTGLPGEFWTASSAMDLAELIAATRTDLPLPLQQMMTTLMLAELPPPLDSGDAATLFLARVDRLLAMGALDQARALMDAAGMDRPEVFARWFDVSLLASDAEAACLRMRDTPEIAPTYPARVFCQARQGDWQAAELTLSTAQSLDLLDEADVALIERFLAPELAEGAPLLPVPARITPLKFRMHDAIGEPLSTGGLPNAFVYARLDDTNGWKARISAAERLARSGAIPPETLFAIYAERKRAASGGVWDRVEAVQAFEDALKSGAAEEISDALPKVLRALRVAGLEYAFAQAFGEALLDVKLSEDAARDAIRISLMSTAYETAAQQAKAEIPALWRAVATGQLDGISSEDPLEAAIIAGLTAQTTPAPYDTLTKKRRIGEAALTAIGLLADGASSDPTEIETALSVLTQLNLHDLSRRTALYLLLTRQGT